jgi:Secretion system C-terminal sorting domain
MQKSMNSTKTNAMKKLIPVLLLLMFVTPVLAQTTYNGNLSLSDPSFNRPKEGLPPQDLSEFNNIYYHVLPFDVNATGPVGITLSSSWNNFLVLYNEAGFVPSEPLTNALMANDDLNGTDAGFTYDFTVTGRYYLVICSNKNKETGPYSLSASNGLILPLKLVSFTASKATEKSNLIKWTSAEESNLLYYQVQRSIDNRIYSNIANGKMAASNTFSGKTYSITDNNPGSGNQYYRLKIEEKTGAFSYSKIAVVKEPVMSTLKIFPNPASTHLELTIKTKQNNFVDVSIFNEAGSLVQAGQYKLNSMAMVSINIQKLTTGRYFIKTSADKEEATLMFIKN